MPNLPITTTQNVKLFFTPASLGERMLAYFIDLLVQAAYLITVYFIFFSGMDLFSLNIEYDWLMIALMTLLTLPVFFYHLLSETLMEGQSLGKKAVKIKVVKIDGFQAGFFDYFIRWIFRIVDIDMMYLPGLISMMLNKYTRRIGDIAAGTAVITEKAKYNISHTILMDVDDDYKPYFTQSLVMRFSDNDMRIIKENALLGIRKQDAQLLNRLVKRIETVMEMNNPFPTQKEFVSRLLRDYDYYTGDFRG